MYNDKAMFLLYVLNFLQVQELTLGKHLGRFWRVYLVLRIHLDLESISLVVLTNSGQVTEIQPFGVLLLISKPENLESLIPEKSAMIPMFSSLAKSSVEFHILMQSKYA